MLDRLDRLVEEASSLNSKLILLIGRPRSGKTQLLNAVAARRQLNAINVGAMLGRQFLSIPATRRHLKAAELLKQLADDCGAGDLVLFDNIELLFDRSLRLSPLDLLKRHAHGCRVVAAWPGELSNDRLTYATMGHPEHQDYPIDGVVLCKVN